MNAKEKVQANIILLISVGIIIIVALFFIIRGIYNKSIKTIEPKAGTITEQVIKEEYVPIKDATWEEADRQYNEEHGISVAIADDYSLLSRKDYLSLLAHFTLCDEITAFLDSNGYPDCEIVTVLPETVTSDNKNAKFSVALDKYPDVILNIESYYETGTFKFTLLTKE